VKERSPALVIGNPAPKCNGNPSPSAYGLLRLADGLVPNQYEAAFLISGGRRSLDETPKAAERIAQIYGNTWCVITRGREGWEWYDGLSTGRDRIPPALVVDKVGASDAFTSMLLAMKVSGAPMDISTLVAGVAAEITITRDNAKCRFPTWAEVIGSLAACRHPGALPALSWVNSRRHGLLA
jgi:sugar/nucleoside kinase (ribokinase family)